MFWKNFKLNPTLIILLIIGMGNGFLFLTKNPLVLQTKHIAISPLPLVFDSPMGIDYWTYTYNFTFETNEGKINIIGDKHTLTNSRRGWLHHIFVHYMFSSISIKDTDTHNLKILNNIACSGLIKPFVNSATLKIYKIHIDFLDLNLIKRKEMVFLCI